MSMRRNRKCKPLASMVEAPVNAGTQPTVQPVAPDDATNLPGPDRLMTITEVAAYANVSEQMIRRSISSGVFHAYRVGKQWRIDKADLIKSIHKLSQRWPCETPK